MGAVAVTAAADVLIGMLEITDYGQAVEAARNAGDWPHGSIQAALGPAGAAHTIASLLAAVAFMIWLFTARLNCDNLGGNASWTPGWAIGGWLLPVASLYIPYKVVLDVREASETDEPDESAPRLRRAPVGLWWAAFIVMSVLGAIDGVVQTEASTKATLPSLLDGRTLVYGATVLEVVSTIVCAVLACLVVLRITRAQRRTAQVHAMASASAL
jgi:hypothetical protein